MDVKKAIACSPLLPPPGDEVVKELGEMYLALEKRCEEQLQTMQQLEARDFEWAKGYLDRDIKIADLKADNTLLRKRLEPIEECYRLASKGSVGMMTYIKAISRAVELKEG